MKPYNPPSAPGHPEITARPKTNADDIGYAVELYPQNWCRTADDAHVFRTKVANAIADDVHGAELADLRARVEEARRLTGSMIAMLELVDFEQTRLREESIRLLTKNLADADARADAADRIAADTGRQLDAAIIDKKAAERQAVEARRVDDVTLALICDALGMAVEKRSWSNALEVIDIRRRGYESQVQQLRAEIEKPVTMPDGYRLDGPLVTNGTIGVLATTDALIIRTSTGVGVWAPLDAVKIAIAEKEKTK